MKFALFVGLAFATLGLISGCGKSSGSTAKGKVSLANGNALPGGSITFQSTKDANKKFGGNIEADGTYEVVGLEPGDYIVMVDNSNLNPNKPTGNAPVAPGMGGGGGKAPKGLGDKMGAPPAGLDAPKGPDSKGQKKYVAIDGTFATDKSTLKATVKSGSNDLNFDLK